MGPDAANLAGSIAKSLEVERSPKTTQRASDIAEDQNAEVFAGVAREIKTDSSESLRRARLLQERERRRREIERRMSKYESDEEDSDGDTGLDVMV